MKNPWEVENLETGVRYFDGETPTPRPVRIHIGPDALTFAGAEVQGRWPLAALRRSPNTLSRREELVLQPDDASLERLTIVNPEAIAALRRATPDLDRPPPRAKGVRTRALAWTGVALSAAALIAFVIAPSLAARLAQTMPVEREQALGETALRVIDATGIFGETCSTPEGDAALNKLVARVGVGMTPRLPLSVEVTSSQQVNAFALPGGHIRIMDGLLREASGPDEVAGVLAHEIGHVQNRDSIREVLRASGAAGVLGLFFGDFAGGGALAIGADQLMNARYTREAERAADAFAIDRLNLARISTEGLADFMRRMDDATGDRESSYFDSHPGFDERVEAIAAGGVGRGSPALTPTEWAALRGICDGVMSFDLSGDDQ